MKVVVFSFISKVKSKIISILLKNLKTKTLKVFSKNNIYIYILRKFNKNKNNNSLFFMIIFLVIKINFEANPPLLD